ncbi:hypothetical protein FCM35_KLT20887 [Carex littledalei]|uniref:Uncharacterized protein n=1 Tax=Carex littledalei TaxID=544730 RepID=A0A833RGK9_9POAL|nr:hypothetical protein FCM35_KLT20887 [Carex littledalei]
MSCALSLGPSLPGPTTPIGDSRKGRAGPVLGSREDLSRVLVRDGEIYLSDCHCVTADRCLECRERGQWAVSLIPALAVK